MKKRDIIIFEDYALVPLTKGFKAIIDICDVEKVQLHNWYVCIQNHTNYAQTAFKRKTLQLHRYILDNPNCEIDHIDHDGLNNRRSNLRYASHIQNMQNTISRKKYKGVFLDKRKTKNKWFSCIWIHKKQIYLGNFETEVEAAMAYNKRAEIEFGQFARLNMI